MVQLDLMCFTALIGVVICNSELKLWTAAKEGNMEKVNKYLTMGTSPLWQNPDHLLLSALHVASKFNHTNVIKRLLDAGVDVNLTKPDNVTALHVASKYGQTDAANVLIENGAGVHLFDEDGRTPLEWASFFEHTDIVTLLIENDADVNFVDEYGLTPLLQASYLGHTNIATLLLDNGADPHRTDKLGRTAGDVARDRGYIKLANIIDSYTPVNVMATSPTPAPNTKHYIILEK